MTLEASTCPACHRTSVPPEDPCLACRSTTEPTDLAPQAEILARTRRAEEAWIVLLELDQEARILARAESPGPPAVGSQGQVTQDDHGFRFTPDAD